MEERAPKWYRSAFTSVPVSFPAAGWTTIPRGLFTTQISPSSYTISRGISSGTSSMGFASGTVYRTVSPSRTPSLRLQGRPLTSTSPSSIRLCARDRDRSVISDRHTSSRRYSLSAMNSSSLFIRCFLFLPGETGLHQVEGGDATLYEKGLDDEQSCRDGDGAVRHVEHREVDQAEIDHVPHVS